MNIEDALAIAADPKSATDEQITQAAETIAAEAQRLATSGDVNDLEALEGVVEAGELLGAADAERAAGREVAKAKAAELLGRLGLTVDSADPDGDEDAAGDEDADADAAAIVVPDTAEGIDSTPPAAIEAPAPVPAAASTEPVVANGRPTPSAAFAAARRKAARPEPAAQPLVFATSEMSGRYGANGAIPDFKSFADGVIDTLRRRRQVERVWSDDAMARAEGAHYGGGARVQLATIKTRWNGPVRSLKDDPYANEAVLSDLANDTARQFGTALTAAGGVPCAPYPVDYSLFDLVDSYNPIEADLPAVDMPRGGVRYMSTLDYRTYANGVSIRTAADENQAPGTYVAKPVVRVDCPTELSTVPLFEPAGLLVGNFVQNSYPELVQQALKWLSIAYEDKKSIAYEDAIRTEALANSQYVAATAIYGAARDYFNEVARAVRGYRARRHMRPDAPLHVHVPYFLPDILAEDTRNNAYEGLSFGGGVSDYKAWFEAELRKLKIVPTYWYVKPTGVATAKWVDKAQASGGAIALNSWPTTVETIITAPGVWNRGVIADIDFGMVVDSPLMRTNDAMFFMESIFSIFSRSSSATEILTSTLCANGVPGALPIAGAACP